MIVIERIFDAPRELVWRAWTEPEHFKKWWGPKSYTSPVTTIDLRMGAKYLNCMCSSGGQEYWGTGIYHKSSTWHVDDFIGPRRKRKNSKLSYPKSFVPGEGPVNLILQFTCGIIMTDD